jgi:F-type H+-transporting ATPase subunit b
MDKRVRVVIVLILVLSGAVFAGGGQGSQEARESEHHFDWWGFLGKLFNSTVLFGGLIILLRKPIINLLAQKSLDVKNDIIRREQEVEDTSGQLENLKRRLAKIEEEVAAVKKAAEKSGNDEKKRIEELGDKESRRILALTEAEIAAKVENSIRKLKARIADLTIEHFKKDIEKQLDEESHERIIEKNIEICGDIIERERE